MSLSLNRMPAHDPFFSVVTDRLGAEQNRLAVRLYSVLSDANKNCLPLELPNRRGSANLRDLYSRAGR